MQDQLFDTSATNLQILHVHLGENGEVPDYYTDLAVARDDSKKSGPARVGKQGIFKMDGYWLALAPRLGDNPCKFAHYGSKFDNPGSRYLAKTLNEYVLLTSDDEELAYECVLRAEASRSGLAQLYKQDMRVNLPAPLHLAQKIEEYIWKPQAIPDDAGIVAMQIFAKHSMTSTNSGPSGWPGHQFVCRCPGRKPQRPRPTTHSPREAHRHRR